MSPTENGCGRSGSHEARTTRLAVLTRPAGIVQFSTDTETGTAHLLSDSRSGRGEVTWRKKSHHAGLVSLRW